LTLLNSANQNLTGGQKLLLHWYSRFGHQNLASVQRILRAVPFHSMKFAAASKCDASTIKCPTWEYAKAHCRSTKGVTHVLNAERIGGLKAEHLRPGIQVSVDHFESRLLGRTFDSFGKASSPTYKGGCIFVDHYSGFLFVEPNSVSLLSNLSVQNKLLSPWRYNLELLLILTSQTVEPSMLTHSFDTFVNANSVSGIVGQMPIIKME
jgi:hypothetical protein